MRFFVVAMPRSRTYWLSRFLTHGAVMCHHELLADVASFDEYDSALGPDDGAAETASILLWRPLLRRFPDARYVIVRRDPVEVDRSLAAKGVVADVTRLARSLDQAQEGLRHADTLTIDYQTMDDALPRIWQHCRSDPMPAGREAMRHRNLQCDLAAVLSGFNPQRYRSLQCSSPCHSPSL